MDPKRLFLYPYFFYFFHIKIFYAKISARHILFLCESKNFNRGTIY